MSVKCVFADTNIIEVDRERYDELVVKENELCLLKQAIANLSDEYNTELKTIKSTFNIKKEVTENEN